MIQLPEIPVRQKQNSLSAEELLPLVLDSITDKKGEKIVCIDLRKIGDAMSDYFVICEANTPTQMRAIAEHVVQNVKEKTRAVPLHTEGIDSQEWILVDYFDLVLHVFQRERREAFALEELWADGTITAYDDGGKPTLVIQPQEVPLNLKKKR